MQDINYTGALISPKDNRDWTLASAGASTIYPDECIINQEWMNVLMQGTIGACVGCTGEEIVRLIVKALTGVQEDLSWRFVYALAKCLEGTIHPIYGDFRMYPRTAGSNDGTYPALVAKIIRVIGVSRSKFCPNDRNMSVDAFCYYRNINNVPKEAIEDAKNYRSKADFTVPNTEDGIKQAIKYAKENNGAVMILRRVGDTYWKDKNGNSTWEASRILPIRVPDMISSGHEEMLYGYKTEQGTGRLMIYWLNHWSKDWADNGRGWEYYDVWQKHIDEIRVVVGEMPIVQDFKYKFTKYLRKGDKGAEVVALQHALKLEGCFDYPSLTGFFGDVTFSAVVKFQEKYASEILAPYNLKKGTGLVLSKTLEKLNELYA